MYYALVFLLGFAAAAAVAAFFRRRGMRKIRGLEQEKQELLTEESRMFSFLHEISDSLARDRGMRQLHEDIVHGVARVCGADGAALYLLDARTGVTLVPVGMTRDCPPLIELPDELAAQPVPTLTSYAQRTAVPASEGLLGRCFTAQTALNTGALTTAGEWLKRPGASQLGVSFMVAPLTSGSRRLGVIAVAQKAARKPFTSHDFEVFRSAAEQSAFALASAMTQQEAVEKRRMDEELRAAAEVQRILLPEKAPEHGDYLIAAANTPAKVMSGDYYDFVRIDDDHMGVVIADVSGKGFPASLVMATCRALLRGVAGGELSPTAALARVNRKLWGDVRQDTFISLAYCVLDRRSAGIVMSRAGHDAPLHYRRRSGDVAVLKSPGLALGVDSGSVFERVTKDSTVTMESGDCLLLYTDGINEAVNAAGDEFGMDRLTGTFRGSAPRGAQAVVDAFLAAVREFAGGAPQHDDITIIAVQRK